MNDNTKSLLGKNLGITYDEMTNLEPSDELRVLESAGIRISDPQTENLDERIDDVTKSKPELFREKIAGLAKNVFSGGYTYDVTCRDIPDKPYQGDNVK